MYDKTYSLYKIVFAVL